jgi:phosphatidylglycerol:prolipoprotein diacylglycerol transferase
MFEAFPILFGLTGLAGLVWLGVIEASPASLLDPATLKSVSPTQRLDLGAAALVGGLLGARLEFCAIHTAYYTSHLLEILAIWQGGLAWGGAALGAVLAVLAVGLLKGAGFWRVTDLLALPAAAMAFTTWLGCQIDGCAYGFHTAASWWTTTGPDWLGMVVPRWPTQTVGALASLLLFVGLYQAAGQTWMHARPGRLACAALAGIALVALALSFTRADPVPLVASQRFDLVESSAVLLAALAGLFARGRSGL